jgi:hypothetical protein
VVLKHRMSMKTEAEIIAFSGIINHYRNAADLHARSGNSCTFTS